MSTDVKVTAGPIEVDGILRVPADATGVVLFAHGSGSGRSSQRNNFVADHLEAEGLASLLIDLLTEEEEAEDIRTARLRFDIDLLAERVAGAARWLAGWEETRDLRIGAFGASTGAAAALVAAARAPELYAAVVSRGGRPDLAGDALLKVRAPTLLIVGSLDRPVIEMNRAALDRLSCEKELRIVEGATHLFEEPGTLEQVADLAAGWLRPRLGRV